MKQGVADPSYPDEEWNRKYSAFEGAESHEQLDSRVVMWRRTHVVIPGEWEKKPVSLVLGGFGLFDYREMRVFFNGTLVGERILKHPERWRSPGVFDLTSSPEIKKLIRYGLDNVIAIQLRNGINRTRELDKIDPIHAYQLPTEPTWPAQFEQYLYAGKRQTAPEWNVQKVLPEVKKTSATLHVDLTSTDRQWEARVTYQWRAKDPCFKKRVRIVNKGQTRARILHIRLGQYQTASTVSEGEQGFPVHIDDHSFMTLAHPSGWARGQRGGVELCQYPGEWIEPGKRLESMEQVTGLSSRGASREAFKDHIQSRMRRILRKHDKVIAVFDNFGSWKMDDPTQFLSENNTEARMLESTNWLKRLLDETGAHFDYQNVHFWVNPSGCIRDTDPRKFPKGFKPLLPELKKAKVELGIWIASSTGTWGIGRNPVTTQCLVADPAYSIPNGSWGCAHCRASEPIRSMFTDAYVEHVTKNNVRFCKFDGFHAYCTNPNHDHLPGIYSTEAIHNALLEFLSRLDRECSELFIMLYWGYRSPWWLLHGDTLFEPGLAVEAASPGATPVPYVRNGVTRGLDFAHQFANHIPTLGKDSLGVWLSDWGWNSSVGSERWQDGFVMDMARGNLLPQIWSDWGLLNISGRRDLATFIALSRAAEDVWRHSQPILGTPDREGVYGYCCTDGRRAFVAIHNAGWEDQRIPLHLDSRWGLPDNQQWDLYRWYPRPRKLSVEEPPSIMLRAFATVMLEVVAADEQPSLERKWARESAAGENGAASRECALSRVVQKEHNQVRCFEGRLQIPKSENAIVVIACQHTKGSKAVPTMHPQERDEMAVTINGAEVPVEPVLGSFTYPVSWQAWRIRVNKNHAGDNVNWLLKTKCVEADQEIRAWEMPTG